MGKLTMGNVLFFESERLRFPSLTTLGGSGFYRLPYWDSDINTLYNSSSWSTQLNSLPSFFLRNLFLLSGKDRKTEMLVESPKCSSSRWI